MEKWNSRTFQDCANPEYERQRRRTKASLSYTSNLALAPDPNPHFWIFNSVSVGPTHLHPLRFEYLFTLRLRVAETYLICDDPLQLEGDVKEPVTLFEKSRGRRPRCHDGVSDLCRNRSGWARCDQHMDWRGCKSAPLHADVRSHLSGSSEIQPLAASEESWHRLFFKFFYSRSERNRFAPLQKFAPKSPTVCVTKSLVRKVFVSAQDIWYNVSIP